MLKTPILAASSVYYAMRAKLGGSSVSVLTILINGQRIEFGKRCQVERFSTLRGSEDADGVLIIGEGSTIRGGAYISARHSRVRIGNGAHIAHNCWISGRGTIDIGDNTLIGPGVVIVSSNHNLTVTGSARYEAAELPSNIRIGCNVWIGANSSIVPGADIGDNTVVAAGSVVSAKLPPNCVARGNPARVIPHPRMANNPGDSNAL